jgi:Rad3-related DNA helicase
MPIELPKWADEIRPHQMKGLQDVLAQYSAGNTIAVLDAPTGAGKTLIGELVRQSLNVRSLYLCSSISLQEQFARDFPAAAILKGRSNYATGDSPSKFPDLNAGDCNKTRSDLPACFDCDPDSVVLESPHCQWCHPVTSCPYEQAKATAIRSSIVCTNTSYFLHEANYVGNLTLARGLIIVDEADLLEDNLLSFVEVNISKRRAEELGIESPVKKTVESAWVEWAVYAEKHLKDIRVSGRFDGEGVAAIRQRRNLDNLIGNVKRLNNPDNGLATGGWVYTGYNKGDIAFKPVTVDQVANQYLWKHSPKWLLMSATTISFDVMMASLGL